MLHMLIIFLAGFLASLFGTLIGGSSLVTIPTLLLLGLPPIPPSVRIDLVSWVSARPAGINFTAKN